MNNEELQAENAELKLRLEEAEETIRAIQSGAVDAFVVQAPEGHRVYTLEGADRPYRLLVEQMQQGAATLRADGTMVYGNRQLAEMLGAPHEKLPGVLLQDFIAPDDRAVYDNLLEQGQIRSGRGEARLRRADGGLTPAFLTFNVLPKDCGAEVGVLVTDLTAQRHHEELEATYKRIDDLLIELRAADRRKDVFLAMLAHELRAPLAPLRNVLEILKRVGDPSELAQQARATMDRQLLHMTRLVDDLLDVSRISQGRIELKRERVELASIIYQALEACRPLAEGSKHQVSVALPPSAIHLHADPVRLVQVFSNLLNNACKYTEPGGRIEFVATVENRVASEPKDGDTALHHSPFTDRHVVVQVRDTGVGIPRDKLGGVFEMFAQIDHSLERAQGGLGIGLTLVKRLVELHGGNVTAHSDGPGRGSEFVVRLPMLTDQPASGRPAAPTATDRTAPQRVLLNCRGRTLWRFAVSTIRPRRRFHARA